jgi:hypothetical protein
MATRKNSKTWLIIQYDDRPIGKYDAEFMKRNRAYAKKHGYHYSFINSGYTNIPPYWRKVAIAKDMLETDKYKGVMWLDTDAVIFNMSIPLDSVGNSAKHFFKATNARGNHIFNAGVWTVKNTAQGKEIMRKWMALYDPSKWQHDGTRWINNGDWAGNDYEQGSFAYRIDPEHKGNINTVNESTFQGLYNNHNKSDVFVYHFYNIFKTRRAKFLKENPLPL